MNPPDPEQKVRESLQKILAARISCPTCDRRITIADISRATSIDYSSLHRFLRGKKNRHLFPAGVVRLQTFLRKYNLASTTK